MVRMHAFMYSVASACLPVCPTLLVWVDFFWGMGVVVGPTTTLEQVKLEADAKAALAAATVVSKVQPMQVEPTAAQVQMPLSGPMALPYDDVFDISMYTAEEIGNEQDVLASFDDINRAYTLQMRIVRRRQVAATWQLWA